MIARYFLAACLALFASSAIAQTVTGGPGNGMATGTGPQVLGNSPSIATPTMTGSTTVAGMIETHVFITGSATTLATGFASGGTLDAISHTNGSIGWVDTVGTTTITSSATFTMGASASYEWVCGGGFDKTTTTLGVRQIGAGETGTVVAFQTYLYSTGAATAPTAGDILVLGPCFGL